MAKRGKNQARRSGRGGGAFGLKWLAGGLVIGGLAFGYLHFKDRWNPADGLLPRPNPQARASQPDAVDAIPEPAERPKTNFEFYDLLPEKEVVIPDAELDAQARAEAERARTEAARAAAKLAGEAPGADAAAPGAAGAGSPGAGTAAPPPSASATPAASEGRYLIQAGAFRGSNEAEALKAKIALTGEIARVEVAQINGNTVHRVRMGPYPNASALAQAKQALASHGIAAQAIKVR